MCRLFGFRSAVPAAVHTALVTERNSLLIQSREHKDGWGIATYGQESSPLVAHGVGPAHCDPDFERVSSQVSARTVVAHIRLASVGAVELRNSHPFHFGRWSFVHNGTLREFAKHKATVEGLIHPELRVNIKGTTDSERCFYLFLSRLSARGPLDGTVSVEAMAQALAETMTLVSTLTDVPGSREPKERSAMNFLVTDGEAMVATRRNRTLFISSGISGCPEALRTPNTGVPLQQFLVSSESLCGGPHWVPVDEEDVVGVDSRLTFHRWKVQTLADGVLNPRPPEQHALV
ncbi:class II glutamine amidotransferase [Corallococcus sp. AB032C]|uniref:class II glutamine amidotransferase n=1 Tax=Corallococcus TaxID=83461 RepID=UPI000EE76D4A|nr:MULTISPECIES: class II glutamine amidotransferase [Corallococcus]NNB86953.1 class II glutamine amidotransferase [Corallococcus exiguus]NPC46649.1 class II glutamine amidotransferase [Corallococcus exiguus]NRD44597.1 class II glutamine amidotransferase [Corallococcus exiguus]RKH85789.1 class II glutamine amidotransferase [Corallococcus sp. AB032C]RKH99569.1 class II glutamine amidotransferase [Corallococcus sp. AB038B]